MTTIREKFLKLDRVLLIILLCGFAIRLHKIDAPIMDGDSYRQGATASIARNYYEKGYSIVEPRITGWGTIHEPGLWPNEFPLYPYVVSRFYYIFGEQLWIGRLITILFCLVGAAALYDLIKRMDSTLIAARFAAFWYLFGPQAIYHGRCFHRHPVAIGLMLVAMSAYANWLETRCKQSLIYMIISGAIALLLMPPLIVFAAPALWMHQTLRGKLFVTNWMLWFAAALTLLPAYLWYSWAIQQPGSWSLHSWDRETFRNWGSLEYYTLWLQHDFF